MSEHTTPEESGPAHEATAESPEVAATPTPEDSATTQDARPWWRKVPLWLWIALGALVLAGGAFGVLAASGTFDPEPLPTPPAETVTAEPPTPTVDPVERGFEPTAFSAVLPDTVLDLALAEIAEGGSLEDGEVAPIEAYTATYSDGGEKQVTLDAAQFADEETATSAVPELSGDSGETGEVLADGILVGEFTMVRGVNGAATLVWRNSTAVFVLEGPEDVVRDVYRAFPV